MPPPTAIPAQRRWFETSRSEANLLTSTLDRLRPSPSRPLGTADRWRSEQDFHESTRDAEQSTSSRSFGFNLAPGAERRRPPQDVPPEEKSEHPKSFIEKYVSSLLHRSENAFNPMFKPASADPFVNPARTVETRESEFESTSRPEPRTFDPAPGAERRNLQYSSSMRELGTELAPLSTDPLTQSEPERSRSSLWSLPSSGLLSRALKRRSNEPMDNASGGLYGKKNNFFF